MGVWRKQPWLPAALEWCLKAQALAWLCCLFLSSLPACSALLFLPACLFSSLPSCSCPPCSPQGSCPPHRSSRPHCVPSHWGVDTTLPRPCTGDSQVPGAPQNAVRWHGAGGHGCRMSACPHPIQCLSDVEPCQSVPLPGQRVLIRLGWSCGAVPGREGTSGSSGRSGTGRREQGRFGAEGPTTAPAPGHQVWPVSGHCLAVPGGQSVGVWAQASKECGYSSPGSVGSISLGQGAHSGSHHYGPGLRLAKQDMGSSAPHLEGSAGYPGPRRTASCRGTPGPHPSVPPVPVAMAI